MHNDNEKRKRWYYFKARLGSAFLIIASIVLVASMIGLAVWRAMAGEEYPATPTIPAELQPGFAYVSALAGRVESQPPDSDPQPLSQGDTVAVEPGAVVRVAENGWLRLGLQGGGTLFLNEDSEIELRQVASDSNPETVIQLNRGRLLVTTGTQAPTLVIRAETGAEVRSDDAVIGVNYTPSTQLFDVHCLGGECSLLGQEPPGRGLQQGERGWVRGAGTPVQAGAAQYELFVMLGDVGLVATATTIPAGVTVTTFPTLVLPSPTIAASDTPTSTPEPTATTEPSPVPTGTEESSPVPTLPLPSPTPAPTETATPQATATREATTSPEVTSTRPTATATGASPVTTETITPTALSPSATPAVTGTSTPTVIPTSDGG